MVFKLTLCKLQSGRKVKCPNNPFSLILTMILGDRYYLHLTDEETDSEKGSAFCKVTRRGNELNPMSSSLRFSPLDHATFSGATPNQEEKDTLT